MLKSSKLGKELPQDEHRRFMYEHKRQMESKTYG
jgi:hypothetical protein